MELRHDDSTINIILVIIIIIIIPCSDTSPGIMTTRCMAVTGGSSIGKCGRLRQPGWLLVCTSYAYLLTYLLTFHAH